jgi:hypothetical protein
MSVTSRYDIPVRVSRANVELLATEWCRNKKGVIIILDDVAKQFATDAVNWAIENFIQDTKDKLAAKKSESEKKLIVEA